MMLLGAASSIFVVAVLIVTQGQTSPVALHPSLKLEWESWKNTHGKTYTHEREESERVMIWTNNKKLIDTHNEMAEENGYTLAMNKFGDMVGLRSCSYMHCFVVEINPISIDI